MVARDRLVVGQGLRLVPGTRLRGARVDVVLPGSRAVRRGLAVVGDGRVCLLVGGHAHDIAGSHRQAAEPVRDGGRRAGEARSGLVEHLVAGGEVQGGIAAQRDEGVRERRRPDGAPGECLQLRDDAGDLRKADAVELRRIDLERGVQADQGAVAGLAARNVAHPRALVGPGGRQDLALERLPEAGEGWPDLVAYRRPEAIREALSFGRRPAARGEPPERRQQGPVVRGRLEQLPKDRDRPLDGCAAGDTAVREAPPEGCDMLVRVPRHRAPALDHAATVLGRLETLVVGDVQEVHRHPLEGVHVPLDQPRVPLGDVGGERLPQGVARDAVLVPEGGAVDGFHVREERREATARRRDARRRGVREPVVEARVAEGRCEQRVRLEECLPVRSRERTQGGPGRGVVHHLTHSPTLTAPVRPTAGAIRIETDVGVRA